MDDAFAEWVQREVNKFEEAQKLYYSFGSANSELVEGMQKEDIATSFTVANILANNFTTRHQMVEAISVWVAICEAFWFTRGKEQAFASLVLSEKNPVTDLVNSFGQILAEYTRKGEISIETLEVAEKAMRGLENGNLD